MKKSLLIAGVLLLAVTVIEFHPAVEEARSYVSQANYENAEASCRVLLGDRPWFGRLNHWFLAWLAFTPVIIFSASPRSPRAMQGGRVVVAAIGCYVLMNLAVHLQWEIRNAPFIEDPFHPDPLNGWRMDCQNYSGDGFSYLIALYTGWIPACLYTGLCLLLWNFYHRRFSGEMADGYQSDTITLVLSRGIKIYAVLILLDIALLAAFFSYSYLFNNFLFHPPIMGLVSMPLLMPLFVPFVTFMI